MYVPELGDCPGVFADSTWATYIPGLGDVMGMIRAAGRFVYDGDLRFPCYVRAFGGSDIKRVKP